MLYLKYEEEESCTTRELKDSICSKALELFNPVCHESAIKEIEQLQ